MSSNSSIRGHEIIIWSLFHIKTPLSHILINLNYTILNKAIQLIYYKILDYIGKNF